MYLTEFFWEKSKFKRLNMALMIQNGKLTFVCFNKHKHKQPKKPFFLKFTFLFFLDLQKAKDFFL